MLKKTTKKHLKIDWKAYQKCFPGPPRASPRSPWGLPGASRGHFRGHATQREKTRKTKSLSGPHFSEKCEIYWTRLDPEIVPEWPQERTQSGTRRFFWCPSGSDRFGRVCPSMFHRLSCFLFFRCVVSRIFRQLKNGKVLKTLWIAIRSQGRHYRTKNNK